MGAVGAAAAQDVGHVGAVAFEVDRVRVGRHRAVGPRLTHEVEAADDLRRTGAEQGGARAGRRRVAGLARLRDARSRRGAVALGVGGGGPGAAEIDVGEVDAGVDHGGADAGPVETAVVGPVEIEVAGGLVQAARGDRRVARPRDVVGGHPRHRHHAGDGGQVGQAGGVGLDDDGVQRAGDRAQLGGPEVVGGGKHVVLLLLGGVDDGLLGGAVGQRAETGGVRGDGLGEGGPAQAQDDIEGAGGVVQVRADDADGRFGDDRSGAGVDRSGDEGQDRDERGGAHHPPCRPRCHARSRSTPRGSPFTLHDRTAAGKASPEVRFRNGPNGL